MTSAFRKEELVTLLVNRSVNLNISRSCFTICRGCYNYFNKDSNLIETSHIKRFLMFLYNENVANKITFAGGDPLSRPDIIEILDIAKGFDFKINLDTVGSSLLNDTETLNYGRHLIKKTDAELLKDRVDMLGIPIDGSNSKIIKLFRHGRKNIFEEQKQILRILEEKNIPVCINTVVSLHNHSDLLNIFEFISQFNNIVKWQIFQYMPMGDGGFTNRHFFEIDDDLFKKAIKKINFDTKNSKIIVEEKSAESRKNHYCMIDSTGQIWLPIYDSKEIQSLGNIKQLNYD